MIVVDRLVLDLAQGDPHRARRLAERIGTLLAESRLGGAFDTLSVTVPPDASDAMIADALAVAIRERGGTRHAG